MRGSRYHVESALPIFEGFVQADPGPVPRVLRFEEVKEHVHRGVVPEIAAEDLKCPDEGPGIWMELAGRDV